jgi:hypothetical protein
MLLPSIHRGRPASWYLRDFRCRDTLFTCEGSIAPFRIGPSMRVRRRVPMISPVVLLAYPWISR